MIWELAGRKDLKDNPIKFGEEKQRMVDYVTCESQLVYANGNLGPHKAEVFTPDGCYMGPRELRRDAHRSRSGGYPKWRFIWYYIHDGDSRWNNAEQICWNLLEA